MAQTYYGIINLLFLLLVVFQERFIRAVRPYFQTENLNEAVLRYFLLSAAAILLLCNAGIAMMQFRRKNGFFLFLAGGVILLIIDTFFLSFDWVRYLLNSGFIFLLGLLHFTGRAYGRPQRKRRAKTETKS